MDGGTIYNVDVWSAINQCLEVVEDESDIIVDIAICDNYALGSEEKLGKNSFSEFFRGRSIKNYYSSSNEIADAKRAYPNVNWRSLFFEKEGKLSGT